MRTAVRLLLAITLTVAGIFVVQPRAVAAPEPSFRVVCDPTRIAQDDAIVFPGQPGLSHMHTFFGAPANADTTVTSLLAQSSTLCGRGYGGVDLSAYWIPTLYKDNVQVNSSNARPELAVYYKRAGAADGQLASQAFPVGLKMIAGDMHATVAQDNVLYKCAKSKDAGSQSKLGHSFPSCSSDEMLIAELVFPDCWDGRNLDSADHKSHMAFSSGGRATCPATHPVKLPQITFEAWFHGVNGPASSLRWSSGGPYSFHGDVISAWNTFAAANLVNQCINVAADCNPLNYGNVPVGSVTQAQINAQLTGVYPAPPSATSTPSPSPSHEHPMPTPTPSMTTSPSPSPSHSMTPTPTPTKSADPTATPSKSLTTQKPTVWGEARLGGVLRVAEGSWGPAPVRFTYQWYRNGVAIGRAAGATYTVNRADIGAILTVKVTGSKRGYVSASEVSDGVGPIQFRFGYQSRAGNR